MPVTAKEYYENLIIKLQKKHPEISAGQMFGMPTIKLGKKAIGGFHSEEGVFRIGKEEVAMMIAKFEGARQFDPAKGRPMKDWLQVPFEYKKDWENLAEKAIVFLNQTK